ncbi:MAG: hypothetical protein C0595_10290 [Marinilabiliales bacterium]|nr:MAG: hypothetical protein C0595_10290 [Marinilabiliales bacterium]
MKYFDEDYLEIHWNENGKYVLMMWKGFAQGDSYRLGLNKGLELIESKKSNCWLADLREMKVLSLEDQDWSNNDWFPRAIKGGIRKMAIVLPTSSLGKIGVKSIMKKVGGIEIETSYFPTIKEAEKWLQI